jgi:hypothetical protein
MRRFADFKPGVRVEWKGLKGTVARHPRLEDIHIDRPIEITWNVPVIFDGDRQYQWMYYTTLNIIDPPPPPPEPEKFEFKEADLYHDTHTGRFWKQGKKTSLWFCLNDQFEAPVLMPQDSWVPFYRKVEIDAATQNK